MATLIQVRRQSLAEIRTYYVDYTDDLPTGVTVSSATATHTPPSGSASTPTVGTISGATVPVTLPAQTVAGMHKLDVLATLSSADKSAVRLMIPVHY
jgi:hypothetical protein